MGSEEVGVFSLKTSSAAADRFDVLVVKLELLGALDPCMHACMPMCVAARMRQRARVTVRARQCVCMPLGSR